MPVNEPLKRTEALKNLSRDHHHGLLLCWKIKTGLKKVDHSRVKAYTDYFFKEHLEPHFRIEEKNIFPLLGEETELVQLAMKDHTKLRQLFNDESDVLQSLLEIEVELQKHIRFEERILFRELQKAVPEEQLTAALSIHETHTEDTWADKFWE